MAPTDETRPAPPPWPVFDAHTHAFPDKVAAAAMPKLVDEALWMDLHPSFDGTLAGLTGSMDRAGFRRAILCSVATRPEQVPKITDWSASVASERIVPFASIHPDFAEPEAECERIAAAGLRGLKFHPQYMACAIDDERAIRIARAAAAAGLAVTFHAGYDLAYEKDELSGPVTIRRLHEAVPDLTLLACHMGGWRRWPEVVDVLLGLPIYLETSYSVGQCPNRLLLRLLEEHPREYLLFGTDAPWADQAEELENFLALPIPDDLKRAMLWDNVHRYAGLPVPE